MLLFYCEHIHTDMPIVPSSSALYCHQEAAEAVTCSLVIFNGAHQINVFWFNDTITKGVLIGSKAIIANEFLAGK